MAAIILYRGDEDFTIPRPRRRLKHKTYSALERFEVGDTLGNLFSNFDADLIVSGDYIHRWADDSRSTRIWAFFNVDMPNKSFVHNHATYFDDDEQWAAQELYELSPPTFQLMTDESPDWNKNKKLLQKEKRWITKPIKVEKKTTTLNGSIEIKPAPSQETAPSYQAGGKHDGGVEMGDTYSDVPQEEMESVNEAFK